MSKRSRALLVESGDEAVDLLTEFDAVVVDVNIPGVTTGPDVARPVRDAGVPAAVVTTMPSLAKVMLRGEDFFAVDKGSAKLVEQLSSWFDSEGLR